ncbi:hypothetical protein ABBQ38_001896 [Trebouxia sp. C0009 RCD-2024]
MATQIACTVSLYSRSREHKWSLARVTGSFHRDKLPAGRLHKGMPAHIRTGRVRRQVAANQPSQLGDRLPVSPDISMLSPALQHQWHVDLNMHLGAIIVKPYSGIKAIWHCDRCPAGQPHVWTASVTSRTHGTDCPYCKGRRVCLHNSLATIAPEAAKYWNHSKNEKPPEEILAGCQYRAEWKCPACKHEWQARVDSRTSKKAALAGCPKCHTRKTWKSQPTFAESQPPQLAEWDHEGNEAEGIFPHKVTLGSNKLVQWICSCCPRGQPHRWTATPANRISNGTGCAVCAGHQACVCNSLESLFPSIAAELDVGENSFAPSEVTAMSAKEVWWRNAERGSWKQTINSRTFYRVNP